VSVGADQRPAVVRSGFLAARGFCRNPLRAEGETVDPRTELQRDEGVVFDRREQRALQVSPMDHPIGCAVAASHLRSQRHDRDVAGGTAGAQAHHLGNDNRRLDAIGDAERDQHPCGVGRKLDAGAGLLEAFRLVE